MRIIGGEARGRKVQAPPGEHTRPTLDRVKEALFGAIAFDLPGSAALDLFAGGGNLGLEGISRGCALCVFNDSDRACARIIEGNAKLLGFEDRARVLCLDFSACLDRLAREKAAFDFVFLDPPYGSGLGEQAIEKIAALGLLKPGGRIIYEHEARAGAPEVAGMSARFKKYGRVGLATYRQSQSED